MFSKRSQSLKVLMVLTVLMTVSQSEALNRLLKVLIVINVPSHSVDWFWGGDHLAHLSQ